MNILALEPYYGGSHKAFIKGWSAISRHRWTVLKLPPYKWKWRMRHAAITFADQAKQLCDAGEKWDIILCSDMLNLAEFTGLAPKEIQQLPKVAYFHENQLTYPARFESERDYQFVMTNITTAMAAEKVWFNSAFHRDSFLQAIPVFLGKMPDYQLPDAAERIRAKSAICPQGIAKIKNRDPKRTPGPLRILWAARWEHDKGPEDFFEALKILKNNSIDFRLSVTGQSFRDKPAVFEWAKKYFHKEIDRWGYQKTRTQYEQALTETDIVVSTAAHEFFGISIVEAIAAGAYPVLPNRLAYPQILSLDQDSNRAEFFYDGSAAALADKLQQLAERVQRGGLWGQDENRAATLVEKFQWPKLAPELDERIEKITDPT